MGLVDYFVTKLKGEKVKKDVENEYLFKPLAIKEFNDNPKQLNDLEYLITKVDDIKKRKFIEDDLFLLKYGLVGERNVDFEIKHCNIPMLTFHNLRIKYGDFVANTDFVLMTKNRFYILETKRLSGDIVIDNKGNFIRNIKDSKGNLIKREGMYSPISQAERQGNIIKTVFIEEGYSDELQVIPLVVIANPKTIINMEDAPREVCDKVIRYDQLRYVLDYYEKIESPFTFTEDVMEEMAEVLLYYDEPIVYNYKDKYGLLEDVFVRESKQSPDIIRKRLEEYRKEKAKQMKVPPYVIYHNKDIDSLLEYKPTNKSELREVKGFGDYRVNNFGEDIVNILNSGGKK